MKKINPQAAASLKQIEIFSRLLDSQFRIPGTNFRFGVDPLLGLIPFAGDVSSLALQAFLFFTMARHGASRKVVILMALNVLVDFIFGSIPLIGDVFDFYFKSSQRNYNLLKRHYEEGKHHGSGTFIIITIFLVLLGFFVFTAYLLYIFIAWIVGAIGSMF